MQCKLIGQMAGDRRFDSVSVCVKRKVKPKLISGHWHVVLLCATMYLGRGVSCAVARGSFTMRTQIGKVGGYFGLLPEMVC